MSLCQIFFRAPWTFERLKLFNIISSQLSLQLWVSHYVIQWLDWSTDWSLFKLTKNFSLLAPLQSLHTVLKSWGWWLFHHLCWRFPHCLPDCPSWCAWNVEDSRHPWHTYCHPEPATDGCFEDCTGGLVIQMFVMLTWLGLMLYFLMVAHKAVCQSARPNAFLKFTNTKILLMLHVSPRLF